MAEIAGKGIWAWRFSWLAVLLSVGGVAAALIAALGSGQALWDFRTGFWILRLAFFAAIAGGVLALLALILTRRARGRIGLSLLALLVSLTFLVYLGAQISRARSVPAIHDVTTNLDDAPEFRTLPVRADNLAGIPDEGDPALAALAPEERWKALHRRAYGDIATVILPATPAETMARARMLAEQRGWEIARIDPAAGEMEATDTSFFFRFKDDIVLRARPRPGGGTEVDMRSISRVGQSDVGVNADRIRGFLADLRGQAPAG